MPAEWIVEQAAQDKARKIAADIMTLSRNRLTVDLRYMANPISMLELAEVPGTDNVMVDGRRLMYDPVHILRAYQQARELPVRKYLHVVLHCVYQHFFVNRRVDRMLWDLAADIAVEATIEEAAVPSAAAAVLATSQAGELAAIRNAVPHMTAEVIYRYLRDANLSSERLQRLRSVFSIDSHDLWYQDGSDEDDQDSNGGSGSRGNAQTEAQTRSGRNGRQTDADDSGRDTDSSQSAENGGGSGRDEEDEAGGTGGAPRPGGTGRPAGEGERDRMAPEQGRAELKSLIDDWKRAAEQMRMDIKAFGGRRQGTQPGNRLMDNLNYAVREKYDYAAFLRQFGVLGEVMKISDEEFDYPFYCYGIERYGNMPLVEPLEYRETHKVREFVIAIDTSGSTEGELVQMFLRKTYNLLKQRENFHTRINVRIIQCDADIQDDVKITRTEELDEYMRTMRIRGGGGTDFRPVFRYVDDLIARGELPHLGGLIYFTDGYGTFPNYQPPYKSAFVFVDDGYTDPKVPVWAIRLTLEPEEIGEIRV